MKKVYRIYSLICAVALFVILQLESFAYLDPSVVTYLPPDADSSDLVLPSKTL